jgi:hypothetical protein
MAKTSVFLPSFLHSLCRISSKLSSKNAFLSWLFLTLISLVVVEDDSHCLCISWVAQKNM